MNTMTIRILLVVFLLAHGWIHLSLSQVPVPQPGALRTPFFPAWWRAALDPSWPVSKVGLSPNVTITVGWVLWLSVTVLYVLSGLALLVAPSSTALWQGGVVIASILSLVLLALYWHPWLPIGILIDLALLAAVFLRWPVIQFAH